MSGNISLMMFDLFDFSNLTKVDQTSSSLAIPIRGRTQGIPKIDGNK